MSIGIRDPPCTSFMASFRAAQARFEFEIKGQPRNKRDLKAVPPAFQNIPNWFGPSVVVARPQFNRTTDARIAKQALQWKKSEISHESRPQYPSFSQSHQRMEEASSAALKHLRRTSGGGTLMIAHPLESETHKIPSDVDIRAGQTGPAAYDIKTRRDYPGVERMISRTRCGTPLTLDERGELVAPKTSSSPLLTKASLHAFRNGALSSPKSSIYSTDEGSPRGEFDRYDSFQTRRPYPLLQSVERSLVKPLANRQHQSKVGSPPRSFAEYTHPASRDNIYEKPAQGNLSAEQYRHVESGRYSDLYHFEAGRAEVDRLRMHRETYMAEVKIARLQAELARAEMFRVTQVRTDDQQKAKSELAKAIEAARVAQATDDETGMLVEKLSTQIQELKRFNAEAEAERERQNAELEELRHAVQDLSSSMSDTYDEGESTMGTYQRTANDDQEWLRATVSFLSANVGDLTEKLAVVTSKMNQVQERAFTEVEKFKSQKEIAEVAAASAEARVADEKHRADKAAAKARKIEVVAAALHDEMARIKAEAAMKSKAAMVLHRARLHVDDVTVPDHAFATPKSTPQRFKVDGDALEATKVDQHVISRPTGTCVSIDDESARYGPVKGFTNLHVPNCNPMIAKSETDPGLLATSAMGHTRATVSPRSSARQHLRATEVSQLATANEKIVKDKDLWKPYSLKGRVSLFADAQDSRQFGAGIDSFTEAPLNPTANTQEKAFLALLEEARPPPTPLLSDFWKAALADEVKAVASFATKSTHVYRVMFGPGPIGVSFYSSSKDRVSLVVSRSEGAASSAGVAVNDRIIDINGTKLPLGFTEDQLFELLIEEPRPISIGFMRIAE